VRTGWSSLWPLGEPSVGPYTAPNQAGPVGAAADTWSAAAARSVKVPKTAAA